MLLRVVTIYDLDMTLAWTATLADETTIAGTVHVPEVSHEAIDGLSDYSVRCPPPLDLVPGVRLETDVDSARTTHSTTSRLRRQARPAT